MARLLNSSSTFQDEHLLPQCTVEGAEVLVGWLIDLSVCVVSWVTRSKRVYLTAIGESPFVQELHVEYPAFVSRHAL
jgi:hypothetical protein